MHGFLICSTRSQRLLLLTIGACIVSVFTAAQTSSNIDNEPFSQDKQREESLFSLDYLKLIRDDVKEVFISPGGWEKSDWLLLSGVTAGVVTLGFFDEDIQRAVQRNRNQTVDDIFEAIQPFGAEYSFAVLGGFYLEGTIFHDSRSKAVALDGLSASIISGLLFVQPMKIVAGRDRPGAGHGS